MLGKGYEWSKVQKTLCKQYKKKVQKSSIQFENILEKNANNLQENNMNFMKKMNSHYSNFNNDEYGDKYN